MIALDTNVLDSIGTSENSALNVSGQYRYLTTRQVACYLNISTRTVSRLVRDGLLNAYRIRSHGQRRFRSDEVDRILVPESGSALTDDHLDSFISTHISKN